MPLKLYKYKFRLFTQYLKTISADLKMKVGTVDFHFLIQTGGYSAISEKNCML